MRINKLLIAIFAFVFACLSISVKAQELQGTIVGTVMDTSGAVLRDALVTITQNGVNGVTRTIHTDSIGSYTVTHLAAGNYTVTVTSNGFKTFTALDVTLYVGQTRSVDAKLQTGAVNQTVTVQQNAVAIDTSTSALAGTISGTQVRELQLNNRNFEELVTLQPGVVSNLPSQVGFGLSNTDALSVNGDRETSNNWTVDGADINDSGSNATLLNVPSVDAIQEFTLERSMYDAGYGRSGGGQVLVATKSGTSAYHGDLYEFDRNTAFNANNYFNNLSGLPIAVEHYNDYGGTVGGPLYIPKVYNTAKDKTFFFWSEEWRKVTSPVTSTMLTPTQDQLNGIATGQINGPPGCVSYNAITNTSTIKPTCYSQNARVYLANVYDKNPANTGNDLETVSYSQLNNTREDLVRLDYNINQKLHFFGRAMQDETPENFPQGLFSGSNFLGVAGSSVNAPGENVVGNLTWTISPRMVNEAEVAYSQGEISSTFFPGAVIDSSAISKQLTNNTAYTDPYGRIPNIAFTGGIIQGLSAGSDPYTERNLDKNIFDNFSYTVGKHTLRAGATVSFMLKTENASEGNANFRFNTFHDFLLGNVATYNQDSRDIIPDLHYYNIEGYLQDDWQVSPTLTLNLGVRYSYFPSPADVNDTLNNFDPLLYNPVNAPTIDQHGNFVPGAPGVPIPATYVNGIIFPTGSACTQAQAIAPGVTCSPYGSHVNPDPKNNIGPRFGFAYVPSEESKIAIHGGYGIFFDRMLNGIWEQNAFQDPPLVQTSTVNNTQFDHPLAGTSSVSRTPNHIVSTGDPTMKNPSYMDYNLSVQDEILRNTVAELAYVGDQGRHLLGEREINQPTLAARKANPTAYVTAVVPYLGYNWFADRTPEYTSNYNSLQLSIQHRTQQGLTIGVAYTWSRTLTNQSNDRGSETYDTYDIQKDYGPAFFNQPQTFVTNYVYDLPFYKEQHGIVGHLLGGWEASGIVNIQSGQSQTITQALDNFDCQTPAGATTGCITGTYPGGLNMDVSDIAPRPDVVAPIHLVKKRTQWFSTSSFKDAIGHFGNSGSGVLLGPGIINFDMAAMKNINVGQRTSFQFRAEFFNAFNHTNFNGVDTGTDDATFGQVLSAHAPREIQFGGKFYF